MIPFRKKISVALWALLALFVCRVLGQLLAVLYSPAFLPPMSEWYSGLMSYKYLLPCQIIIIVLFTKITMGVERNRGFWSKPNRRLGVWLRSFGVVYFAAMVLRYTLRMSWYPEERWLGGTIPIIFHCVLATYVVMVGVYLLRSDLAPSFGPRLS